MNSQEKIEELVSLWKDKAIKDAVRVSLRMFHQALNDDLISSNLGWHDCVDGVPDEKEYEGFDWVIVRFKEPDTDFVGIPHIAEFGRLNKGWHIANIEDSPGREYYDSLVALQWKPIDSFEASVPKLKDVVKKVCESAGVDDISNDFEVELRKTFNDFDKETK